MPRKIMKKEIKEKVMLEVIIKVNGDIRDSWTNYKFKKKDVQSFVDEISKVAKKLLGFPKNALQIIKKSGAKRKTRLRR